MTVEFAFFKHPVKINQSNGIKFSNGRGWAFLQQALKENQHYPLNFKCLF